MLNEKDTGTASFIVNAGMGIPLEEIMKNLEIWLAYSRGAALTKE